MPSTTDNIEAVRAWLLECPALAQARIGVDYLEAEEDEFSLYSVPSSLLYTENILGERVLRDRQVQNIILAGRQLYGADIRQNLDNLGVYQSIVDWIHHQNNLGELPDIASGDAISIVPTLSAYPTEAGAGVAKYQIQLQLTYRRH